jgi:hypothetical protein
MFLIFIIVVVGEAISLDWDSLSEKDIMDNWWDNKVKWGYIMEDGTPIKCFCGCSDLKYTVVDRINYDICEQDVHCIRCGKLVGHWGYGSWEPM